MTKKGYLYAVLAMLGWGTGFVAQKVLLRTFTPGTMLCLRYFLASLILWVIYRNVPRPKIRKEDYKYVLLIGVLGYFGSIFLQMMGTDNLNASMSSLINTMTPVGILFLAIPVLGERATMRKTLAILLTVVGAAVIVGRIGAGNSMKGIILATTGMLLWALTSVIIRKTCEGYDGIWLTIYTQLIAAVCAVPLPVMQLMGENAGRAPFGLTHLAALLYFSGICTAGANLWWTKALEINDANTCGMFYALLPITTAVFGVLLLHEQLTVNFFIGGIIIIAGMLLGAAERS